MQQGKLDIGKDNSLIVELETEMSFDGDRVKIINKQK